MWLFRMSETCKHHLHLDSNCQQKKEPSCGVPGSHKCLWVSASYDPVGSFQPLPGPREYHKAGQNVLLGPPVLLNITGQQHRTAAAQEGHDGTPCHLPPGIQHGNGALHQSIEISGRRGMSEEWTASPSNQSMYE